MGWPTSCLDLDPRPETLAHHKLMAKQMMVLIKCAVVPLALKSMERP